MNETLLKLALPGVLFVFAIGIIVQAFQMTGPLVESDGHIYPIVVASLLAVGSLSSMVVAVREPSTAVDAEVVAPVPAEGRERAAQESGPVATEQETATEDASQDRGASTRVLAVLGASTLYPVIMPLIGFHLATVLYATALSLLLQDRSWKGAGLGLAAGVGVTVFCHLVFIEVLNARLPSGSVF
ncbi:tripartite tricarboxylate transporter TctB family protein [Bogoriella caseilytica]|uniref:Tripartite tricarboxylate transporter TctB family protein n=1 Tax=Bogoriella caseilytica TaxID=56055 RepID=A0A3N2BCW5_9MICO|nr:tripartite tricarboxylate transporter TctB family protein [Bogoriella caseilytica]ROR73096.1 tripartite tricarboxylate transporter TctB family protein [Bogoriella caseilytica]